MKPVAFALVMAASLLLGGCKSTSSGADAVPVCTCGTTEAQVHGCHHPDCVSGKGNPDNPNCLCAPLVPAAAQQKGN